MKMAESIGDEQTSEDFGHKRAPKPTEKALQEKLHRLIGTRKGKFSHLTTKMKEIDELMSNKEDVYRVQDLLQRDVCNLHKELVELNDYIIPLMDEEERKVDQEWFTNKLMTVKAYVENSLEWVSRHQENIEKVPTATSEVSLEQDEDDVGDSVSQVNLQDCRPKSRYGSVASGGSRRSSGSSVSTVRAKEAAEHAALLARAAALEQKQALDLEEAKLKAKREKLEVEAALAESTAKLKVLASYEEDSMSSYVSKRSSRQKVKEEEKDDDGVQPSAGRVVQSPGPGEYQPVGSRQRQTARQMGDNKDLHQVLQKQSVITETLVRQHNLASLPRKEVPVFKGDPLTYKSFIRSFEHAVESKADTYQDKFYYLEQYVSGEAQELVRSCEHMPSERGYKEARRLLQKHYGNELKIANAYMEKALNWPIIKQEDGKALSAYALFLTGCKNTMGDLEFMEEMDNPTNMRTVLSKLPYKVREKWRVTAFEIQEKGRGRARFSELVEFIDRQAKIVMDPLFGSMSESHATKQGKEKKDMLVKKGGQKGNSSFATGVEAPQEEKEQEVTVKKVTNVALQKPCVYCHNKHTLTECRKLKERPLKDRLDFLKSKGLCFGCLFPGHLSKDCKRKAKCQTCLQRHPDLLHMEKKGENVPAEDKEEDCSERKESSSACVYLNNEACAYPGAGGKCALAVLPVKIKSKRSDRYVETYAFMDPGSTASFCTEDLLRKLKLRGRRTQILLNTMGCSRPDDSKVLKTFVLTDLEVCGVEEDTYIDLPRVFTHSFIPVQKENIPKQEDIARWPYLKDVSLPQINAEVGLLIGTNVPKAMEPWQVIHSEGEGPYAVRTALGWVVNGPLRSLKTDRDTSESHTVNRLSVVEIEEMLRQQYNADFPERGCEEKEEMSQEDHKFMSLVSSSARLLDGHYCVRLPLKDEAVKMPNNRCIAEQRAISLKKKLKRHAGFHEDYKAFMNDVIENGYAVKVPRKQLLRDDGRVWYIPHQGVYHPKKKKIRVVFDCTATYRGVSLNEQLLQGPNLTNTLIGVLMRFRQEPVALMADVKAMFYQVKVPEEDADLLRFLWWPDGNLSEEMEEFRMTVHLFGATSSPSCSSYALRKTAEDNRGKTSLEAADTVLHNFYVDDCLKSVSSEAQAIQLVKDLRALCAMGGFQLTKWVSSSKAVLLSILEEDRATDVKDLDLGHNILPMERALGVQWCTNSDSFKFQLTVPERPMTRRGILSVVSALYDPLGFLAPVILPAKQILRTLCEEKCGWDQDVKDCQALRWQEWLAEIKLLEGFTVSRCVQPTAFGPLQSVQLHHFADASETGYGTATYMLLSNQAGGKCCTLLMGKARVAPLKRVTIPRLELTAAVVAVKMDQMLRHELQVPLQDSIFWTDSTTVLRYIENEHSRFKTFVANRVTVIREHSHPSQWHYVKSGENPADQASRGMKVRDFVESKTWLQGPSFLLKSQEEWPELPYVKDIPQDDPEVKSCAVRVEEDGQKKTLTLNKLILYYSDWTRLRRAVTWLLKLKEMLLHLRKERKAFMDKIRQSESCPTKQVLLATAHMKKSRLTLKPTLLLIEDLEEAENELIRVSQLQTYPEEILSLQAAGHVKKTSPICRLDPFLKDGIVRVGGRLSRLSMPEETKHPAILGRGCPVAALILQHIHKEIGHCGCNYMLAKLRTRYWIPQVTSAIRGIISRCSVCRRLNSRTGEQKMADLPLDRITPDQPPFTNVGVDFFGPFEVKRGRSHVKRYGVLFTCLTIRAVHTEVAHSLDTDSCINALRRFTCRRGQAKVMRSDNGANLVAAERELRAALRELNQKTIADAMMGKGVKWIFNAPAASHHGGVWERQIRTVRKILNSIVRQQSLDDEGLLTVMCEVESIINNRPLTPASDDPGDLDILTPNHLLRAQPNIPPGIFSKDDHYARRRWRQVQYMVDLFWTRWLREYLPLLQNRQKWSRPKRNFQEGDIVLIADDTAPRNSWIMGRITKTLPDAKGVVRRAVVQTKTSQLDRPVSKLCLMQESG